MHNNLLLTASIALFVIGSCYRQRARILLESFFSTVFLLYTLLYLLADHYTGRGIDSSVWFHLRYGVDGVGADDFIQGIPLVILLIFLAIVVPFHFLFRDFRLFGFSLSARQRGWVFSTVLLAAFLSSPTTKGLV